jgi:fluoride ion exporter CrcB/FEX
MGDRHAGIFDCFQTVFLGAGLGGVLRHGVNIATAKLLGSGFLYGTLTVNIVGSLIMGLLIEWFALSLTRVRNGDFFDDRVARRSHDLFRILP